MASETVCGGQSRQRHVMLSESHDVEVRMVLQSRRDEPGRYVLIRYEGTHSHKRPSFSSEVIDNHSRKGKVQQK